jgi:hypothetical protein
MEAARIRAPAGARAVLSHRAQLMWVFDTRSGSAREEFRTDLSGAKRDASVDETSP